MRINIDEAPKGALKAVRRGDGRLYLRSGYNNSKLLYENGHIQDSNPGSLESVLADNKDAVGIYEGETISITF